MVQLRATAANVNNKNKFQNMCLSATRLSVPFRNVPQRAFPQRASARTVRVPSAYPVGPKLPKHGLPVSLHQKFAGPGLATGLARTPVTIHSGPTPVFDAMTFISRGQNTTNRIRLRA